MPFSMNRTICGVTQETEDRCGAVRHGGEAGGGWLAAPGDTRTDSREIDMRIGVAGR